jgi:hypothetical protein
MGFFTGRVTFQRYRVTGRTARQFGPEHIERLATHAIGKQRLAGADGVETGWTAGDHILDTRFDLAKNIVNDTLHFALRIDHHKIPADLLRAYTMVELEGVAAGNPSGLPSQRQRKEARAAARERLEAEVQDGRYLRRKVYPVLWDCLSGELLVGTTSITVIDRLLGLFQHTFGHGLEALGAGTRAYRLAEVHEQTRNVEDAEPSAFGAGPALKAVAWSPDETSRDFLGNEFLLWLWYVLDTESDTIKLSDDSEVTVMLARTLSLECPRGQTGRDAIYSEAPVRLPEARRAIRAGKWPRKVGLTLVRHDEQYELTLHGETLAVASAKLPAPEADDARACLEKRVEQLRHVIETLDLLYDAYGQRRFGSQWPKELHQMQRWLQHEERGQALAVSG